MKNLRLILVFLSLLQLSMWDRALACSDSHLPVFIDVVRKNGDSSTVCPLQQGEQFLSVNGQRVGFYSSGHQAGVCASGDAANISSMWSGRWSGCLDKRTIYANSANEFNLSICTTSPNGGCAYDVYVHRDYTLSITTERGQSRKLIATTLNGVGASVNQSCTIGKPGEIGTCLSRLDTAEILENTKAEVVILEGQTSQLKIDYALAVSEYEKAKAAYDAALAALNKPIEQLTESDFAAFDKASKYYAEARTSFDAYKGQIEQKERELSDRLINIQNAATNALSGYGIDPKDEGNYIWATDVELPPIVFPPLPGETPLPPAENVFKVLADNTIPALQAAWIQDNRQRFLEIAISWAKKSAELLDNYKERTEISASELSAYSEQIKRVEDFIYGVNSADGYLTRQQWFKDSVVPVDLRSAVDNMLAKRPDDPLAVILKEKLTKIPSKIDDKTFSLVVLSYALVSYFSEFRKIYEAAVAEGYKPPPSAPPSAGNATVFAGYSWQTLTAAYYADKKAIEELKEAAVMGIDLYASTSLASPLVSLCRLASGNSTCRFSGEKDLNGWDYVFSGIDSLALLAPLKGMLSALKTLPSIGGKIFVVPERLISIFDSIQTKAIELGLNAAQEVLDFADLLRKVGVRKLEEFTEYVSYLKFTRSAKSYIQMAKSLEDINRLTTKVKILNVSVSPFYTTKIANARIGEAIEQFYVVRVYGPYTPGEVPKIKGIDPPGAVAKGSFWSNKLYLSEKGFREGSVVFEEWNKGSKITLLKVKRGTRVVFGQGLGQVLTPGDTFNGVAKTLADSPDWQFGFPPDQAWLDAGNNPGDWIDHLIKTGYLEMILEEVPTGWRR